MLRLFSNETSQRSAAAGLPRSRLAVFWRPGTSRRRVVVYTVRLRRVLQGETGSVLNVQEVQVVDAVELAPNGSLHLRSDRLEYVLGRHTWDALHIAVGTR